MAPESLCNGCRAPAKRFEGSLFTRGGLVPEVESWYQRWRAARCCGGDLVDAVVES